MQLRETNDLNTPLLPSSNTYTSLRSFHASKKSNGVSEAFRELIGLPNINVTSSTPKEDLIQAKRDAENVLKSTEKLIFIQTGLLSVSCTSMTLAVAGFCAHATMRVGVGALALGLLTVYASDKASDLALNDKRKAENASFLHDIQKKLDTYRATDEECFKPDRNEQMRLDRISFPACKNDLLSTMAYVSALCFDSL